MKAVEIREEFLNLIVSGDDRLIKILYAIAKEYNEDDLMLPGKPMTQDQLIAQIEAARSRIKAGNFTSQQDLEEEMKKW